MYFIIDNFIVISILFKCKLDRFDKTTFKWLQFKQNKNIVLQDLTEQLQ